MEINVDKSWFNESVVISIRWMLHMYKWLLSDKRIVAVIDNIWNCPRCYCIGAVVNQQFVSFGVDSFRKTLINNSSCLKRKKYSQNTCCDQHKVVSKWCYLYCYCDNAPSRSTCILSCTSSTGVEIVETQLIIIPVIIIAGMAHLSTYNEAINWKIIQCPFHLNA